MMRTFHCGDTTKFNLKRFLDIHLEACRMFNDIGEPLSDSMKIVYQKETICPEDGFKSSMEDAKKAL